MATKTQIPTQTQNQHIGIGKSTNLDLLLQQSNQKKIEVTSKLIDEQTDDKQLLKVINDWNCDQTSRIQALNLLEKKSADVFADCLFQLISQYSMMQTSAISELLQELMFAKSSQISFTSKTLIAETFLQTEVELGMKSCSFILSEYSRKNVAPIMRMQIVYNLMKDETHAHDNQIERELQEFLLDNKIEFSRRYKTLIGLGHSDDVNDVVKDHLNKAYLYIATEVDCEINYKLLACQYLLQTTSKTEAENKQQIHRKVSGLCLQICENELCEYNIRADAADIVINLSDCESDRQKAQTCILKLGSISQTDESNNTNAHKVNLRSIYNNQSVHNSETERNISEGLRALSQMEGNEVEVLNKLNNKDEIMNAIKDLSNSDEEKTKVNASILRISLDQTLYAGSLCLETILIKVWNVIQRHAHKETLQIRLKEELCEMADTCSSGHVLRLLNVFSGGFGVELKISLSDQIYANLSGRFMAILREHTDQDFADNVLDELTQSAESDKSNVNKFVLANLGKVYKEMHKEFCEDNSTMNTEQFDLLFRESVSKFEGI